MFPEDALPMRIRIAPGADLTADPSTYSWQDITADVSFARQHPISLKIGADDEEQESLSELSLTLRNHESRVAGVVGRYTTDNPESDLWPDFDLNCPIEFAVDPDGNGTFPLLTRQYLAEAEDEWPDNSANLAVTHVTANGLLRRLQRSTDVKSALLRTITAVNRAADPLVYYPLEEGVNSAVPQTYPDGRPGVVFHPDAWQPGSAEQLGGVHVLYGVTPLSLSTTTNPSKVLNGVELPIPDHAPGVEIITLHVRWNPFGDPIAPTGASFCEVNHRIEFQGGNVSRARILFQADTASPTSNGVFAYYFDSATDTTLGTPTDQLEKRFRLHDGAWHEVQLRLVQSGGDIAAALWVDGVLALSNTAVGKTLGKSTRIVLGASGSYDTPGQVAALRQAPFEVGHVTVHTSTSVGQFYAATTGHAGEMARERIARLCAEEGVPVSVTVVPMTKLGPQLQAALVPLLRECEKTDRGVIDDSKGVITYRGLRQIVNQGPAITIDGAMRELFMPITPLTDDAKVRNDVTATSPVGGSARYERTEGRRGTGRGRYTATIYPNAQRDEQLRSHASWRAWEGAVGGKRYPLLRLQLHAAPQLVTPWAGIALASRATITNPPRQHAKGGVDLLLRGWTQTWVGRRQWTVTATCQRYDPYEVLVVKTGADNRSRIPAGVSSLAGRVGHQGTALTVISAKVPWIDSANYAAMFPFDIVIAGERMRVTACGNGAAGTVTTPAAFTYLAQVQIPAGTWTIRWSVQLAGTVGAPEVNNFGIVAEYNLGGSSGFTASVNAGAAGTYPQTPVTLTIPAGGANLAIKSGANAATAGAQYTGTVINPQLFTVVRSIDGVVKDHAISEAVQLWKAPAISL